MPEITVVTGPSRSGKTAQLIAEYCRFRAQAVETPAGSPEEGRLGVPPVHWIAPHATAVEAVRRRLLLAGVSAELAPGLRTLGQLASAVVASGPTIARPLSEAQRRWLIGWLIESHREAGRLNQLAGLDQPGALLEFLSRLFTDYGQQMVTAAKLRAIASNTVNEQDQEIAELYSDYRRELALHHLLDPATQIEQAARQLDENQTTAIQSSRLTIISHWDHPTPLEQTLITSLINRSQRVVLSISTPAFEIPDKAEANFEASVAWLRRQFDDVKVERLQPNAKTSRSIRGRQNLDALFMREHLFRDPRQAPASPKTSKATESAAAIKIVPTDGTQHEAAYVARQVKQLLQQGLAAEDVLLAARRVGDLTPRFREAFREVGVPLAVEGRQTLGESPLVRTLLAVLRLPAGDWLRHDVLRVVTTPTLQHFETASSDSLASSDCRRVGLIGHRAATEHALRLQLLPKGRVPLLHLLQRMVASANERANRAAPNDEPAGLDRQGVAAQVALQKLTGLAAAIDALPSTATPLRWFDALRAMLDKLGYQLPTENQPGLPDSPSLDLPALETLETLFASLETIARWRNESPPKISFNQLIELLEDGATRQPLGVPRAEEGHVRLLSAESARVLRPRHLFVVGLGEHSFPAGESGSSALDDRPAAERRAADSRREMQLFHELVASPSESLTLSFAALDASAQPLNPSSYVAEIERLFLPRSLRIKPPTLADLPPLCAADLRTQAVQAYEAGDGKVLRQFAKQPSCWQTAGAVLAGVRVSLNRSSGDDFGAAEGMLLGAAAQQKLAARFNPEHHWSASQLETYATCPFQFYLKHVLKMEAHDPLALDLDYRRRGSLLHNAMERFHSRLRLIHGEHYDAAAMAENDFVAAFERAVDEALLATNAQPHERAVARVEAMQAVAWGGEYQKQIANYNQSENNLETAMRPVYFEARFGPKRFASDEEPDEDDFFGDEVVGTGDIHQDEPFALQTPDEKVLLQGRIDRIDLAKVDGRTVFNIIDYKTSAEMKSSPDSIRSGRQLQLFLYALAAERHLLQEQQAIAWKLGYWAVRDGGFKPPKQGKKEMPTTVAAEGMVTHTEEWQTLETEVLARVQQIVTGIRAGKFPMYNTDENCGGRCEFRTTCRVAQARSRGKLPPQEVLGPVDLTGTKSTEGEK